MVWGMNLPKSFGKFFPDGEFLGWEERLRAFYAQQPPEVQRQLFDSPEGVTSYAYYVSQKFKNEVGTTARLGDVPIVSVLPHEAPEVFVTETFYEELGSLLMLNSMILAVDGSLKEIIDRLEPSIHKFFPIEIRTETGDIFPEVYYTIVIGQYFDSFLPDRSKQGSFRRNGVEKYFPEETKKGMSGMAFSNAIFGKAHLWRETRVPMRITCFSDELQSEIARVGLQIPPLYKMMQV